MRSHYHFDIILFIFLYIARDHMIDTLQAGLHLKVILYIGDQRWAITCCMIIWVPLMVFL
jgi:hypothetical protein